MDIVIKYFKRPRQLFQLIILLVTLAIGLQFYLYVRQAAGSGPITIARPAGVEGFLPIGALMGWKQFAFTGRWDMVHPAAMVILGWAVFISFLLRKTFCGWFCPVGTLSEWLWHIGGTMFGKNYKMPSVLDIALRGLKYLLLGFFLWIIGTMSVEQIAAFMHSPYYKLSDVKMLHFFTRMSALTLAVLCGLLVLSLLFKNFWCRYLCPYGALLGLAAMVGPTRIQRSESNCIDCKQCDRVCPSRLKISQNETVRNPECIGCMDCIKACPVDDTLDMTTAGLKNHFWTQTRVGIFIGLFFLLTVYTASIAGFWQSGVSDHEFRVRLESIDSPANSHPEMNLAK